MRSARPRRTALAARQVALGWAWTLPCAGLVAAAGLVPGDAGWRLRRSVLRSWGRGMLRLVRVGVVVEGLEHLDTPGAKIATFNHASILDAYIVTTIIPERTVAAVKREVMFYPGLAPAILALRFLVLDRRRTAHAKRTLERAVGRIAEQRLTVLIAPEGTRTRDGELRVFKKGAAHLAAATGAPIVPIVIDGTYALQPRLQKWAAPGRVRVRVLAPIDTRGLGREQVARFTDELRALYSNELARMRRERAPARGDVNA